MRIALKVPNQLDQLLPPNCCSLTLGGILKAALYELEMCNSTGPALCGFIVFGAVSGIASQVGGAPRVGVPAWDMLCVTVLRSGQQQSLLSNTGVKCDAALLSVVLYGQNSNASCLCVCASMYEVCVGILY